MEKNKKTDYNNLDPKLFELIEQDDKKYDKKFETKPIGYFQDAMIRFGKNKTNVVATIILFTMILLSVMVPLLTTKNFTIQETQLGHLPPRVPILENLGIFNGLRHEVDQTVDRNTLGIHPEAPGMGVPETGTRFNPNYIVWETLENRTIACTDRLAVCYGGLLNMQLERGGTDYFVTSSNLTDEFLSEYYQHTEVITFVESENPLIQVGLAAISPARDTRINVYLVYDDERILIGTRNQVGNLTINPFDVAGSPFEDLTEFDATILVELKSASDRAVVELTRVRVTDASNPVESPLYNSGAHEIRMSSPHNIDFFEANNTWIEVKIDSMTTGSNTRVDVMLFHEGDDEWKIIYTFTGAGTHVIKPFDIAGSPFIGSTEFESRIRFHMYSEDLNASVVFEHVSVYDDTQNEPLTHYFGYELSVFERETGGQGRWVRRNGELVLANYSYDLYGHRFDEMVRTSFPMSEYDQILAANPVKCQITPDPDNPEGWLFGEGCPIIRVNKETCDIIDLPHLGYYEMSCTYNLVLNYAIYSGYDEIPYYLFGTTAAGYDLFAITWLGLRTSLTIGLIVASINISAGIVYGSISGYYGGKVDLLMERFSEIVGRVPWLVWLSIFVALIGPGVLTLVLILTVSGWIGVASVTRTQFYRYKGREYVLSSRTLGAKDSRLIFRHILPNGIGTIITSSILMIPFVIFSEATISYLGFGIGHGQTFRLFGLFELSGVSIGVLLADGRNEMLTKPYLTLFPAIIISILMITFNLFGNALRDAFNPSLRGSE